MSLPVKQLPKFQGDPLQYHSFLRGFELSVSRHTNDQAELLAYLIQCCEGEAYEAVRRCTILDPKVGFKEALRILERRFGEPHVIARGLIDEMTDGPILKPNDSRALVQLADSMRSCSVTLKQLRYESDLNSTRTLRAIVQRLPTFLQNRWIDVASVYLKQRNEPTFDDLTDFINDRADAAIARSVYLGNDRKVRRESPQRLTPKQAFQRTTATGSGIAPRACTLATNIATDQDPKTHSSNLRYKPTCSMCRMQHYLDQCPDFTAHSPNRRLAYIQSTGLCMLCLKPNHELDACRTRRACGTNGCRQTHHPMLHLATSQECQAENADTNRETQVSVNSTSTCPSVALGLLPIQIKGPAGIHTVMALLDAGSDSTFVSDETVAKLGLVGTTTSVNIGTISGRLSMPSKRVSFQIIPETADHQPESVYAWSVPKLPELGFVIPEQNQMKKWPHLADVPLNSIPQRKIDMLIDMDVPKAHWALECKYGKANDPYALRTPLGWVLLGPLQNEHGALVSVNNMHCSEDDLAANWNALCDAELADTRMCKRGISHDDKKALGVLENSDCKYQISLPWGEGCSSLESNLRTATRQLQQHAVRLKRDDALRVMYNADIEDYTFRGYAKPAPSLRCNDRDAWYLSYHPVFHPEKPSNVRVVVACACKVGELSLNEQLSGPDIVNSPFWVSLRFRRGPSVLAADIEAMFHQVKLLHSDRRCLRFLWWKDGYISSGSIQLQMTVHPFGAKSLPFCATYALQRAIEDNRHLFTSCTQSDARRSFYVDDCLLGTFSSNQLLLLHTNTAVQPESTTCYKWLQSSKDSKDGDLLLITEPNVPWSQWTKAVVMKPVRSNDGIVRRVELRTSGGVFQRDVRHLCLLEAQEESPTREARDADLVSSAGQEC